MKSIKMLMIAALTILSVSVFAQTEQNQKSHKTAAEAATFSCPMHPEITSNKGGKCSKCGMVMVKTSKRIHNTAIKGSQTSSKVVTKYVCQMDGQICDKAGKCPKCGMEMTKMGDQKK